MKYCFVQHVFYIEIHCRHSEIRFKTENLLHLVNIHFISFYECLCKKKLVRQVPGLAAVTLHIVPDLFFGGLLPFILIFITFG